MKHKNIEDMRAWARAYRAAEKLSQQLVKRAGWHTYVDSRWGIIAVKQP